MVQHLDELVARLEEIELEDEFSDVLKVNEIYENLSTDSNQIHEISIKQILTKPGLTIEEEFHRKYIPFEDKEF